MDYKSREWFNLSAPLWKIRGVHWRLWNIFNRWTVEDEHWWGFGILQIESRHLFGIFFSGVSILFIGEVTDAPPGRRFHGRQDCERADRHHFKHELKRNAHCELPGCEVPFAQMKPTAQESKEK